ncbi:hypothetical protein SAHL_10315 [Salinisphaera orenii YIM 95161]|uniref:Uncharacterized protein n=1 Tax=Salinisphaera orenii YIM 95161 TaxID=1051139 RepID=A0A423PRN9_9GAMM|nr:hypothetical protein SAHL_10315 [Salinisphaera halophila YIM 95161]
MDVYSYWIGLSVAAALLGQRLVWVSQLRRLSAAGP